MAERMLVAAWRVQIDQGRFVARDDVVLGAFYDFFVTHESCKLSVDVADLVIDTYLNGYVTRIDGLPLGSCPLITKLITMLG
jgi:hypothetical protein